MLPNNELPKPQSQRRAVTVNEQVPGRTKASTTVQFGARPAPTKAEHETSQDMYVVASGAKYELPTIRNTVKTFDLKYKEPFKIRLPHIVTTEPSSISATLHITVEPLTNASSDDLPNIRVLDRNDDVTPLIGNFYQLGNLNPLVLEIPHGYPAGINPEAQSGCLPISCGACFVCCRRENYNTKFLMSLYGFLNFFLIISLFFLTLYGLRSINIDYQNEVVVFIAWSQMMSHVIVLIYKTFITAQAHELPKAYEAIHLFGTFILMVISATWFHGKPGLPENSWHLSLLCIGIALIALAMLTRL